MVCFPGRVMPDTCSIDDLKKEYKTLSSLLSNVERSECFTPVEKGRLEGLMMAYDVKIQEMQNKQYMQHDRVPKDSAREVKNTLQERERILNGCKTEDSRVFEIFQTHHNALQRELDTMR